MKKFLLLSVAIVAVFCLAGCKDKMEAPKAGDPVLKNIDFKSYDAFAVMRESNGAKGLSDGISSNLNRLFGLTDNSLEKIALEDEKGLEWACNEVKNIGNDFLLMGLSYAGEAGQQFKNYCVDKTSGKIIDLEFLVGEATVNFSWFGFQSTSEGLFAKKDGNVVKVDAEAKTLTPLTNPETDGAYAFYRDDAGNMLVVTSDRKHKLFPPNGMPVDYSSAGSGDIYGLFIGLANYYESSPLYFMASPDNDMIISLALKRIYHISSGTIVHEYLPYDKQSGLDYDKGILLYPGRRTTEGTKRIVYHSSKGLVTVHDISTGEIEFTKYNAPSGLTGTMGYDNGIFYYSTNDGIFALELETQVTTPVFEGSVSSWKMAPGGLIYTKYLTATDTQTCFYNFATKETEVLSSSGVEVVSIANFVE